MTTVLLLRGWMRDKRHWEVFPDQLQQGLESRGLQQWQVRGLDLPGNGSRWQEASPTRVREMVEALRSEVSGDTLKPMVLLGISMGGMIAAEWAARYPRESAALCLINSSMRPWSRPWQRLRPAVWPALIRSGRLSTEERERMIMELTLSPTFRTRERLLQWSSWSSAQPVSASNRWRQLIAAARFRLQPPWPETPCLVLAGAKDGLVDPQCSSDLATALEAELHIHPEGGHDLPVEASEWVIEKFGNWLVTHIEVGDLSDTESTESYRSGS